MTDAWGITDGYWDAEELWHSTSATTRDALHEAFDAVGDEPPEPPGMWFVHPGDAAPLWNPADLVLEDGTVLSGVSALPMDLPLGYHWLQPLDGWPAVQVVVTPGRCPATPKHRWGWSCQLYAVRSRRSWGIGDLDDLAELARWTARLGGDCLLVNPMHAPPPDSVESPSPYFASSRLMATPLALAVEAITGAAELADEIRPWSESGRALNSTRRIDRSAVWAAKRPVLERIYRWQQERPALRTALDTWIARNQRPLQQWGTFCAISERHARPWDRWPDGLNHPDGHAVEAFAGEHADRVRFHIWLQWQLDRQRAAAASRGVDVIGDLAVGFEPAGFDAWLWQDLLAIGTRIGAPPDKLGPQGQDWGLPPFVPWRLRDARYAPFVQTVRAALDHCGGIRLDHVMGLFRLYCIPVGHSAPDGAYVSYPSGELLDLLALEATRAGVFVVGEDLGTVQDEVRRELRMRHVLGCKVWWFEKDLPNRWPADSVASASTHDLPTLAGIYEGTDRRWRGEIGVLDESSASWFSSHLAEAAPGARSAQEAILSVHRELAEAGSSIVLVSLDDALAVQEPVNVPGTVDQWPNWRIALPTALEELQVKPDVLRLAETVRSGRAATRSSSARPAARTRR